MDGRERAIITVSCFRESLFQNFFYVLDNRFRKVRRGSELLLIEYRDEHAPGAEHVGTVGDNLYFRYVFMSREPLCDGLRVAEG